MLTGKYSKFIVAIIGVVTSGLSMKYGTATWEPTVIGALSAIAVLLIPNTDTTSAHHYSVEDKS